MIFLRYILALITLSQLACSAGSNSTSDQNSTLNQCQLSCTTEAIYIIPLGLSSIDNDFSPKTTQAEKVIRKTDCQNESNQNFTTQVSRTNGSLSFATEIQLFSSTPYQISFLKNTGQNLPNTFDQTDISIVQKASLGWSGFYRTNDKTLQVHLKLQRFFDKSLCQ